MQINASNGTQKCQRSDARIDAGGPSRIITTLYTQLPPTDALHQTDSLCHLTILLRNEYSSSGCPSFVIASLNVSVTSDNLHNITNLNENVLLGSEHSDQPGSPSYVIIIIEP